MIDFKTNKLIIMYYPMQAGGKFLMNSLGLSNFSVFQSQKFAKKQLEGKFSKLDKINYLLNELEKVQVWNDLNLGCEQLFEKTHLGIKSLKIQNLTDDIRNLFDFPSVIEDIIKQDYYLFVACHDITTLARVLNFWPNAQVIEFVNYTNFQKKYRAVHNSDYDIFKGESWPDNFPSMQEYLNLESSVQLDMENYYEGFRYFRNNKKQVNNIIFEWNTDNYMSYEDTLFYFKELCKILNLNDIDLEDFKLYYKSWIDKLSELSKNYK